MSIYGLCVAAHIYEIVQKMYLYYIPGTFGSWREGFENSKQPLQMINVSLKMGKLKKRSW